MFFLRNGARLYLDVAATPSTPPRSATAWCSWSPTTGPGNGCWKTSWFDAEQRLADEGIGGDIYLFKNNTDSAGNSYGCHENYLIVRAGEFSRISMCCCPSWSPAS